MANTIKISVDGPDDLLLTDAYGAGAIVRLQSCATEGGVYANLATATIVSGTRLYTMSDPTGTSSTWYRTRYENAGATRSSDWSAVFQAGGEDAGYLCSIYDVSERVFGSATPSSSEQEILLEIIREVSSAIEHYTGRWLRPRPLSGTATYRFHTEASSILRLPRGIRSISTLGIASSDGTDTGGTYTTLPSGSYFLNPPVADRESDWPATSVRLINGLTFYRAYFGAEITGAFGWESTPADIRGVAIEAVTRRYIGKETAAPAISIGPAGGVRLLASLSPDARATLDSYRVQPL